MPQLVTTNFRLHNAKQFYEAFNEAGLDYIYFFISRVTAWPGGTPISPLETVSGIENTPWMSMIAAKRINASDVSFVVKRYDWTSGTVYAEYSNNSTTQKTDRFFVITEDYNVYKCLYNNYGAASTVKPTGTSTSNLVTSDGYVWKYMYTVSSADALKFLTLNYVPVKTLTADDSSAQYSVQQAAANGSIQIIDVTSIGGGYLYISNNISSVTDTTNFVLGTEASGSDDTYNGSTFYIASGTSAGEIRNITDYVAATRTVTVDSAFSITPTTSSVYHIGPKVTITGDGSGAKAYANVHLDNAGGVGNGAIQRIELINVGTSYSRANVSVTDSGQSNAVATARLSPPGGHGSDPVKELYGHNIMMNVRLEGSVQNNFPTNNDFRTIGLLKNPLLANGSIANNFGYDTTTRLTVTGVTSGPLQQDEYVNGGTSGAKGKIVTFANTNGAGTEGIIKLIGLEGTFTATETITGNTSSATATISSVANSELLHNKGEILYLENRNSVSRTADQIEDIKIIVQF